MTGRSFAARLGTIFAWLAVLALPACTSGASDHGDADIAPISDSNVRLGVQVAPGLVVDEVQYTVSGNGITLSGFIDTSDPSSTVSVLIQLAAGSGYTVSMTAVTVDGVHCAGSQGFSVVQGVTDFVFVNLLCEAQNNGSTIGGKTINGMFTGGDPASCPDVASYAVSPLQTSTGSPISLTGSGTAGTITTNWFASPDGFIADPHAASTAFFCSGPGVHTLTFAVSDGKSCLDFQTINVTCLNPSECFDGVVEFGEQCDDGNLVAGDGCTQCQFDGALCGNGVVDAPVETCEPPAPGVCSNLCRNLLPVCGDGELQTGEECDPPVLGRCTASCQFSPAVCGDSIVQSGEQCDPPNPGFCTPACQLASVCGNFIVQPGEQCDPPNPQTCSPTCQLILPCGNGFLETGEQCDPPVPGFCSMNCQTLPQVCGDGFVQPPEECDDGNFFSGDGCAPSCQLEPICGNGVIDPGEACDPPLPGSCNSNCLFYDPSICGNGVINPGEECDPANTKACDSSCQLGGTCTACEELNCGGPAIHTDCTNGPNATLCIEALHCARVNDCYRFDPANCYCGTHDIVSCQNTAPGPGNGPVGPCVAAFNAAAGGSSPTTVLLALTDPSTPLGRAGFIQQCDIAFCSVECF